jgi:carbon monoxide dehydrogenase subunit G
MVVVPFFILAVVWPDRDGAVGFEQDVAARRGKDRAVRPGATVDRVDGDEIAGRVRIKVGPITASYAGTARFVTKDETEPRLVLQGSGRETRGSGTASATVEVRMSEEGSVTRVMPAGQAPEALDLVSTVIKPVMSQAARWWPTWRPGSSLGCCSPSTGGEKEWK